MSRHPEQSLEGGGLSLRFRFSVDRFAHEVWLADGSSWVRVLSSAEGTAADIWPASPPLQSLHIEDRPRGNIVAFLVGMAGQSHWSASIELDASLPRLRFDLACRVHGDGARQLGSSYTADWPMTATHGRQAVLVANGNVGKRLMVKVDQSLVPARVEPMNDGFVIRAAQDPWHTSKRTIRWSYTLTAS